MTNAVKPTNTSAIEKATNRAWADWVSLLNDAGADEMPHAEIAVLAQSKLSADLGNPGWWAQSVAIAYEQQLGRRVPGQKSDGTFAASVSKTFAGSRQDSLVALAGAVLRADDDGGLDGVRLAGEPRTSETEKWSYWRGDFADGSRASISISDAVGGKAKISVEHGKLPSPEEGARWKAAWKGLLAGL